MTRIHRLVALFVLCSLALAGPAAAQDNGGDEDFKLMRFRGGTIDLDLALGLDLVGGGVGAGTMGGVISRRVGSGAASIFSNPAELGLLRYQQMVFDTKLAIGTNTIGLDADGIIAPLTIEEETDKVLAEDLNMPTGAPRTYTKVRNIEAGQAGRIASFAIAIPVHEKLTLALGSHYPIDLSLNAQVNGIEAMLDAGQTAGDQVIDVKMLMNIGVLGNFRLSMNTLSFGAGTAWSFPGIGEVSVGATLDRHNVRQFMNLDLTPQGMVMIAQAQEYHFNDPGDPNLNAEAGETNNLYLRVRGDFEDTRWGGRFGINYQPPVERVNFSVVYTNVPAFSMTDPNAFAQGYMPSFLSSDDEDDDTPPADGEEEELFDISKLNLAKPNLTEQTNDSLGQMVDLSIPSSLRLGMDVALGQHTLALNYVQYLSDLSYGFTYGNKLRRFGKEGGSGFKVGMDFKFPEELKGPTAFALIPIRLLFLDIDGLLLQALKKYTGYKNPHYRFGGGVILGAGIVEGLEDDEDIRNSLDLPIPTSIAWGRQYTVLDDLDVGVMLFGFPDLSFRFSFAYTLR